MAVYLIHIAPAYRHARHYIGFTDRDDDLAGRYKDHLFGNGSPLLRAAVAAGCALKVAHLWPDADRRFERYLKDRRDTGQWCPLCRRGRQIPAAVPPGYRTSTERRFAGPAE